MADFLPFARPTIDEVMIDGVADTLRSLWIATGPQVKAFEKQLSDHVGGRPVITLTSATAALEVALQLIGAGPGDEIITPAQNFFAAANMIEKVGATTVFVDVELKTRNINLVAAEAAITSRTKALLPTDFNAPLNATTLAALAKRHDLRVIQDAALSIGSRCGDQAVGSQGDLVAFSFHPNKNMTTIEGGALVMNNDEEVARASKLRFHGISRLPDGTRDVDVAGGKFNMSDVSARLGIAQLAQLDRWCGKRRELAAHYFQCLSDDSMLSDDMLPQRDNPGHSWNMFTLLLPLSEMKISRAEFIASMHAAGIGNGISYEAVHLTSLFRRKGYKEGMFPVSERIARETISLPMFPTMALPDVERTCESLRKLMRSNGKQI
jgi:dTDP-4-amino-4,6-dideoxygalactose transaminase